MILMDMIILIIISHSHWSRCSINESEIITRCKSISINHTGADDSINENEIITSCISLSIIHIRAIITLINQKSSPGVYHYQSITQEQMILSIIYMIISDSLLQSFAPVSFTQKQIEWLMINYQTFAKVHMILLMNKQLQHPILLQCHSQMSRWFYQWIWNCH